MNKKGVTLIELLAAVVLVAMVVSGMSLLLPRASKAAISNRNLATAKNLATGEIQVLKQQPYAYVPLTLPKNPAAGGLGDPINGHDFTGPNGNQLNGGCDCDQEVPSTFPLIDTLTDTNGITFTRSGCVNLVNRLSGAPNWTSYCPDGTAATDYGIKNIRVHVSWVQGSTVTYSVDAESVVTRS